MRNVAAFLAITALGVACAHKPPPAPPPLPLPPPVALAPPPAPPPAPPKCEALTESCTAQPGTLARIKHSGFSLTVPQGWTYAQQEDATVATANGAIMAMSTYDAGSEARTGEANRETAFEALVKVLGVTAPKHKVTWARPAKKSTVGALEVSLWQTDDVAYAGKKGPMLVFATQLPDKSWLLGAGFVPADDATDSDKAILNAIQSIAPAASTTAAVP